ncbi:hypothetical protein FVR03_19670 [Pontibacter qinzhouensis]|uniref:Uncharacterized protein n=1 Tax=Pontibacter qinzhouensis TaxID=2603253 RepID=A0A5C8J726_9BACT|nr:hypothetical protein [Pontibacter qinzhouensis]TXK31553.1 hypothetical protein FVR03_19670 [Pontibacter qinzhouensis]
MNPVFDLGRLGYFIKRQLNLNLNSLWIAIVSNFGTMLVISALFAYFNRQDEEVLYGLRNMYLVAFSLSGYVFTSMVFKEMNSSKTSYAFLTLPVSKLEKLVGAWLVSAPVFVVLYGLMILLLAFFSSMLAQQPEVFPSLFDHNVWVCVKVYLVTQSIFFLGACTFNGNNFLKTLLALLVFAFIIGLYSTMLGYLLFNSEGQVVNEQTMNPVLKDNFTFIFTKIIPFIFWYLLAPFMLVVSYFKLQERQV